MFNLFRKKVVLDTHGKIEAARTKVNEAFKLFAEAKSTLQTINTDLQSTVEESTKTIHSLQAQLRSEQSAQERATNEIKANEALAAKLAEFIPQ